MGNTGSSPPLHRKRPPQGKAMPGLAGSFGMGMLTTAVQSHYGWQPSKRSLANFDVLPTGLADLYPSYGVRHDLLFDFNEGKSQWRLAGEARGRSAKRPQGAVI
ncbi:MAG: hypothetical protein ABSB01_25575, partial [Streptosporangiaceae bacterium]|jgi:hypothetical protein